MSFLGGTLVLVLALALQAALGRLWPDSHRYVDLFALPPLWYGVRRSQLSAMTVGCAAGLLQDAWFRAGVYGLNGFKKTLLGWGLGAFGARLDLNTAVGRFCGGAVFVLADTLLDLGLRRLLDLQTAVPGALELTMKATLTGLLALWIFPLMGRAGARLASDRTM